jgi:hypothetical protein
MRSLVVQSAVLTVLCVILALVPSEGFTQQAPASQATPATQAVRAARRDRALTQSAATRPPAAPTAICADEPDSVASSAPSFEELRSRLSGRYAASGGEKDDSTQTLRPPANPAGEAADWIRRHNAGLRSIIGTVFSDVDMNAFGRAERDMCGTNVYCIMTYREQAIGLILGN